MKLLNRISWGLWIPGTLLYLLGWFNLIPRHIGDIGKWAAIGGVVLHFIPIFARMADVEPDPTETETPKK